MNESLLLLVENNGRSLHIVDPHQPTETLCRRPLAGNGQFGHPHKEDLTPAQWFGDPAGLRQRTVADERANMGHLIGVCARCRAMAGLA